METETAGAGQGELEMALNKHMALTEEEIKERQKKEQIQLTKRMRQIKHKIVILSGKGGVGKSTVSTNLAITLSQAGKRVGLLDVDIHGPSIPKMLNLEDSRITGSGDSLLPVELFKDFKVMSIGFLLKNQEDAVIVRGPMKYHTIRQFLKDVAWGELDYLIIDSPPGTGDEPLTVAQSIENIDGAIIVTTPQQVAITDVRKSITFCRKLEMPIIGVLENMSGFVCPHCGKQVDIFSSGGGKDLSEEMGVPFLGRIPLDPGIVVSGDDGTPYTKAFPDSPTTKAFREAIGPILNLVERND
jgi:Mrp family chromosome partitioning ATPase